MNYPPGAKFGKSMIRHLSVSRVTIVDDKIIYGTTEGRLILRQQENGKVYEIDLGSPIESLKCMRMGDYFYN